MKVMGIETSCDETGVAVLDTSRGLLAHLVHSQAEIHALYGGVVPELASRDHIARLLPLVRQVLAQSGSSASELDGIAYTAGPGLAGALLIGASFAESLAFALDLPAIPVHHLEGHLLSPLLSRAPPAFPFIALLVSGGHTQLMRVRGVGRYETLGESLDDAAGEAFDKTAKLLGLGYPGGPELAALAASGTPGRFRLPRPMMDSSDLSFSFSGLKTAVLTRVRSGLSDGQDRADLAAEFQEAVVDVLVRKSIDAVRRSGLGALVIAGGVGANARLRQRMAEAGAMARIRVFYPELELCTDNGAMIALAGALRLEAGLAERRGPGFSVRPRWPLQDLSPA